MSHSTSNRTSPHDGLTARRHKESIEIVYDAELKDLPCCVNVALLCTGCSIYNKDRSYLYLRENSIETNFTFAPCFGFCQTMDFINVTYFDRPPYSKECKMFMCFPYCEQPKLEVVKPGCLICCVPVNLCDTSQVVLMPFETFPFPCCCCTNRVSACDNCFGLCGPITGNPKVYSSFYPQPSDAEGFVAVAQPLMLGQGAGATTATPIGK